MLVLSRKQGQSVHFAELDIIVKVIAVKGSRVQLGIEAPRDITVTRPEKNPEAASEIGSDTGTPPGHNDVSEARRLREELSRVEAELAALAELAAEKDTSVARQVAAESISRLEGIRRSLLAIIRERQTEARPIAEFVKVRAEVLDQLRRQQSGKLQTETGETSSWPNRNSDRQTCVRQSHAGYAVESKFAPTCTVA